MATTEQIIAAATDLGKQIADHDAAKKFDTAVKTLESDTAAQRDLNDYNRFAAQIMQKQSEGKPIEVEDKRKLETLQKSVMTSTVLRDFQMAQMDLIDLLRRIDDAMLGSLGPGQSALISPATAGAPPA